MREARGAAIVLAGSLLAGCVTSGGGGPAADRTDAALFRMTLEHQKAQQVGRFTVRADPRPLAPDAGIVEAAAGSFITEPKQTREARRRIIAAMGLDPTDAVEDARCVSSFPPSPRRERKPGCPDAYYTSVAVSLPRAGGADWPNPNLDGTPVGAPRATAPPEGARTVRVIKRVVQPDGANLSVWDYVFVPEGNSWRLHETVNLFVAG